MLRKGIHYITVDEFDQYQSEMYSMETHQWVLNYATHAAQHDHCDELIAVLVNNTYYVIKSKLLYSNSLHRDYAEDISYYSSEVNPLCHVTSPHFYIEQYPYLTLEKNGEELLAAAIRGHAKDVVKYLFSQNVKLTDKLLQEYIDHQTNIMACIQNELNPDAINTFIRNQDPQKFSLFIFLNYIQGLFNHDIPDKYNKLRMLLNVLPIFMNKDDQYRFIHHVGDFIDATFFKLYHAVDKQHGDGNSLQELSDEIEEFKKCLSMLSQYGFTIHLKSIDSIFKDYNTFVNHPWLVKDINNEVFFWGYSNNQWKSHKIKSSHLTQLLQNLFPKYDDIDNRYFVSCEDKFVDHLLLHHTPFLDMLDDLDSKLHFYIARREMELKNVMNGIRDGIEVRAKQKSSCLHFGNSGKKTVFTKLYKQMYDGFSEESTLDKQLRMLIHLLEVTYQNQADKKSSVATSLQAMLQQFADHHIISINYIVDRDDCSSSIATLCFNNHYETLIKLIENTNVSHRAKLALN